MRAIGMMSGTSLDGIDVALVETDGVTIRAFGPAGVYPYRARDRMVLRQALETAETLKDRTARPGPIAKAEAVVTDRHLTALREFMAQHAIAPETVEVIGFHGQSVLHRPQEGLTVQIGDAATLARGIGVAVVSDFRAADMAQGGEGAPLVPVFHQALVAGLQPPMPTMVVNIGGVANVTYIDGDTLVACDTGPGNALIDDFMLSHAGVAVDKDGAAAALGTPDEAWLTQALAHPFFKAPPPKSLDRNAFSVEGIADMSAEDGAATLTQFTARSIAAVVPLLPSPPQRVIIAGGGARNPTLMAALQVQLAPASVATAHDIGWNTDALEAQAFAYLAVRSLKAMPLSFPSTTGVAAPCSGGVLTEPG